MSPLLAAVGTGEGRISRAMPAQVLVWKANVLGEFVQLSSITGAGAGSLC